MILSILVFSILIISRLFFAASFPYFYDAPEYLELAKAGSFSQALSMSHDMIHPLYILLIRIFYRLIPGQSAYAVSLVTVVFGILGAVSFYFLVKMLFNRRTALLSVIPLIIFPHLFLLQTNIMHEAVEQSIFIAALLSWVLYMKKRKTGYFFLTLLLISLSFYNYIGMVAWAPIMLALTYWQADRQTLKKYFIQSIVLLSAGFVIAYSGLSLTMVLSGVERASAFGPWIFEMAKSVFSLFSPVNLLRLLRNGSLIIFFGYSPLLLPVIPYSFYVIWRKKQFKLLWFFITWIVGFFLSVFFWHGGLAGRLGGLIGYGLALLMVLKLPAKWFAITIMCIIPVFIYTTVVYKQTPIPIIQKNLIDTSNIDRDSLLVISDYQRPQLKPMLKNKVAAISSLTESEVEKEIESYLEDNKKVYITRQAITFPYWQYDGQMLHILSMGDRNKAALNGFLSKKKIVAVKNDPRYPLLTVFRIEK